MVGSAAADTAVFGTAGARLNGDTDVDLTFSGLDQVELDGNNGADTLSDRRRWRERRADLPAGRHRRRQRQ